jgi:hypothetical protein
MIDDIPIAFIESISVEDTDIDLPIAIEVSSTETIPEIEQPYVHREISLDPLICHCWCCIISIICSVLIIYILIGIKILVT